MPGRLPEETHVGAVHLQISDLQRSVDYYEAVLGMAVLERAAGRASLGVPGTAPLAHLVERSGVAPVPRRGRFGLYHFAVLLPDRVALGRFAAHVLRHGLRPGTADHAVSESLYLTDPDGLGIEVYADRPRASWTYRDGELVMTTEPLDLGDLISAGNGRDWTGAPAGTTMGHVHLHVGDLAAAEAFYHRALGFDKKVWSYPGALFLSAGGYHHHMAMNVWNSRGAGPRMPALGLGQVDLALPNADALGQLGERLAHYGTEVRDDGRTLTFQDPWNNTLKAELAG